MKIIIIVTELVMRNEVNKGRYLILKSSKQHLFTTLRVFTVFVWPIFGD